MVYSIATADQYREWFGEDPGELDGWFKGYNPFLKEAYHLFYNNIVRSDDLTAPDLDRDFSALKMQWGDQYLMPAKVIHAYFAARMTQKDGYKLEDARDYLADVTKRRIAKEASMHTWRKSKEEFQNFEIQYSMALHNNTGGDTDYQKRVIEKVHAQIPNLCSYPREIFEGPCETKIHIIGTPETPSLITQMGKTIAERKDILTVIAGERRNALHLLEKISPMKNINLFLNGGISEERKKILRRDLSYDQLSLMERLVAWQTEDTVSLPEKPDDDIPF